MAIERVTKGERGVQSHTVITPDVHWFHGQQLADETGLNAEQTEETANADDNS